MKTHRKSDEELLLPRAREFDEFDRAVRAAEKSMAETISEALYGDRPEERVARLRESVGLPAEWPRITGLSDAVATEGDA